MLVRYGLRGVFEATRPHRAILFLGALVLSQMGGFRTALLGTVFILVFLFFTERVYRSRILPFLILGFLLGGLLMVPFANRLPLPMQRAMSFLPLDWNPDAVMTATTSSEWRYKIWRDLWPKVPQYLLLGKGYALTADDFNAIASQGGLAAQLDASNEALAISGDYHNGPLSTLIPFGIWGAIGIIWLQLASLWVMLRNYRYGEPELDTFNRYMLAWQILQIFSFYFVFGAFDGDVGHIAIYTGLSIAMNQGICRPKPKPASNPRIKPLAAPAPAPAPQAG
jgi:hypothetical protein